MKKITFVLLLISSFAYAQEKAKQDTTISIQMNINQFRALLGTIDANVDSKKVSRELLEFLQKSAQIIQPKDKPKDDKP